VAIFALTEGILNLGLSLLLIGRYGILGVAAGTALASVLCCLGLYLPYARRLLVEQTEPAR
jgi:O-antigen/teichoic acid export membrane protein